MVERNLAKVDVAGSSPVSRSIPSVVLGRDFFLAPYPSGKGEVCKTFMHQFESDRRLKFSLTDFISVFFKKPSPLLRTFLTIPVH